MVLGLWAHMERQCPICRRSAAAPRENKSFPFCSPRCKAVDLGRWFTESYRIAAENVEPEWMEDLAPSNQDEEQREKKEGSTQ